MLPVHPPINASASAREGDQRCGRKSPGGSRRVPEPRLTFGGQSATGLGALGANVVRERLA
jgi:hypothetical protein